MYQKTSRSFTIDIKRVDLRELLSLVYFYFCSNFHLLLNVLL